MKPDEPITPKASQRVIEGDVVEDPKRDAKASASPKSSTPKKSSQWLPQTFMQKMVMVFLLAMLGLGSFWVWQSNQQDWQIERINQLQQHQKALKEVSESLQKRLQEQAKRIEQLSVPAQKPVFSQADLDHMNAEMQAFKNQVTSRVDQLSESLSSLSEKLMISSEATPTSVMPSDEQQQKAQQLVETATTKLKQELSEMRSKVTELFDFQTSQPVQVTQAPNPIPALNDKQRQQWIAQINTQWILGAEVDAIKRQLKALEQAVVISEWPEKNMLIRQIGEDLAQLNQPQTNRVKWTQAKQAVKKLTAEIQALSTSDAAVPAVQRRETMQDNEPSMTTWQQLLHKIQALFRIQKRDSADDLSQVQQLIQRDVFIQRALLHLERINWALEMKAKPQLRAAKQDLSAFMDQYFPENQIIQDLLTQIDSESLSSRQALHIAGESNVSAD